MNQPLVTAHDSHESAHDTGAPNADIPWLASQPRLAAELSPTEAVAAFTLSLSTLRRLLACDALSARKVSGPRGKEWRIPTTALEHAGFTRRAVNPAAALQAAPDVRRLTADLTAERARTTDLDQRLGYALLTVGRLRGRLREAGINPDELFGGDLEVHREASRGPAG